MQDKWLSALISGFVSWLPSTTVLASLTLLWNVYERAPQAPRCVYGGLHIAILAVP